MTNNTKVRIAAVCGAMSRDSRTKTALSVALEGASELDVETELIELFDGRFAGEAVPVRSAPQGVPGEGHHALRLA